jgi:hypothetical protein
MNDKDQFDAFMRLADFRMNVRKERRQLQWRVSLGLWIALAAGMIAFANREVRLPEIILALFLIAVVVGHAYLWVVGNWWRNERDAKKAYSMIAKAKDLLHVKYQPPQRPWEEWIEHLEQRWGLPQGRLRIFHSQPPFFEMLATVILAAAWLIINVFAK